MGGAGSDTAAVSEPNNTRASQGDAQIVAIPKMSRTSGNPKFALNIVRMPPTGPPPMTSRA